uniref:DZF domain-containing protein n=1 Tax=Periophthalmus magnuspinnatus TaxID=409849 RepID=A0A3B4A9I4_9GOBI
LELLVEKAIVTSERPLGAGEALRRVFESISSGLLLEDGPGIKDPCEKDPVDAIEHLSTQQREDITKNAQHILRQWAFGQMRKVLGMGAKPKKPQKPESSTNISGTVALHILLLSFTLKCSKVTLMLNLCFSTRTTLLPTS